jgi:hypothetical protein
MQPFSDSRRTNPITEVPVGTALLGRNAAPWAAKAPIGRGPGAVQKIKNKKYRRFTMENATPITMQVLARPGEKPLAQEQWVSMEKQYEEQWKQ